MGGERTRGLIIGKFMPPHKGHLFLIDQARRQVDELVVVICSTPWDPIPGGLRFRWLQELRPDPQVKVLHLHEALPWGRDDLWDLWHRALLRMEPGPFDLVFTSEPYGERLAADWGARHVAVDPARSAVPISATEIRKDPLGHWAFLPQCVRPYFVRRVVILGSESTGKTTLAQDLARHYGTVWVPEYARAYLEARGGRCEPADIEAIARGQIAAEEAGARKADKVLICDTDLITTEFWSRHYFGSCPEWIAAESRRRRADLYLLTTPDVPWVPDAIRDRPAQRVEIHRALKAELQSRLFPFVPVSGSDWAFRFQRARDAVDAMLKKPKLQLCGHLRVLEEDMVAHGVPFSSYSDFNGTVRCYSPWAFDVKALRRRLALPDCIKDYEYLGYRDGFEAGFECTECKHLVAGEHPQYCSGKRIYK